MNWQKFIGITFNIIGTMALNKFVTVDWKIIICCVFIGVGGVIYGDAK